MFQGENKRYRSSRSWSISKSAGNGRFQVGAQLKHDEFPENLLENVRENNDPPCKKKEKNKAFLLPIMSRLAEIYGPLRVLNWRDAHRLLLLRKADLDLNKHKVEQPWGGLRMQFLLCTRHSHCSFQQTIYNYLPKI